MAEVRRPISRRVLIAATCCWLAVAHVAATSQARKTAPPAPQRVTVKPGAPATALSGSVKGDALKQYAFPGTKGQTLALVIKSDRVKDLVVRVFPVEMPQGSEVVNNYISSESTLKGTLPTGGDYVLQVGLRRHVARRDVAASFTVEIALK